MVWTVATGNVVGVLMVDEAVELPESEEADAVMLLFLAPEPDGAAMPEDDGATVAT